MPQRSRRKSAPPTAIANNIGLTCTSLQPAWMRFAAGARSKSRSSPGSATRPQLVFGGEDHVISVAAYKLHINSTADTNPPRPSGFVPTGSSTVSVGLQVRKRLGSYGQALGCQVRKSCPTVPGPPPARSVRRRCGDPGATPGSSTDRSMAVGVLRDSDRVRTRKVANCRYSAALSIHSWSSGT